MLLAAHSAQHSTVHYATCNSLVTRHTVELSVTVNCYRSVAFDTQLTPCNKVQRLATVSVYCTSTVV